MGERDRRNLNSIASFSMPVRLRSSYQTVRRLRLEAPCRVTCKQCWRSSVLNPRPSRELSEVGDEELELARARVRELFFTALEAVEPARAVRNRLDWHGDCLVVGGKSLTATKGVHVVAVERRRSL